jgi:integrase
VASITTAQINAWLRSLRDVQPKTRNNFRRVLHAIFEFAVDEEYCTFNPVAKAARAKDIGSDPEALTATEATALLEAAGSDMVPAVAIGLFAGLRRSEIETLLWSDVMFSRGLIQVGRHCKGARKRFVKIEPNLAQWLAPFSSLTSGPVVEAFRYKLDALREAAKLTRWPNNALRHSYGSYHLAHFMDAKRTSLEMGHKDVSVTFDHYRELVLPEDAALYWQIAPKPKDDEQRSENIIAMPAAA